VVNDLDMTMGLYGNDHNLPTFNRVLLDNNNSGALLRAILRRPEMLARFSQHMEDVITLMETRVPDVLAQLYDAAYHEIGFALAAGRYNHWVSRNSIADNHRNILRFTERRGAVMRTGLARLANN